MAVAVLVLEPLAVERGAPRRRADQEAARARVAGRVGQIADPLQPEHRVEDEEGDRRHLERRKRGAGGDEGGHRARFGDPLFEDLAVARLLVEEQPIGVDGFVELPAGGVDAELAEHPLHPERA